MVLRENATISPFPSASTSPATTPWTSSAILSDFPTCFRVEGIHPSAAVVREGGGGGAGVAGAAADAALPAGTPYTATPPPAAGAAGAATGGGGAGETARIAPWTPKSFSAISPESRPRWRMMSSSVAATAKNAPADAPVVRSVTVVSMLYPFPSLETVPWSRRGYFASFAASCGTFPSGGRRRTSAPASAIRRDAMSRGRTATVEPMSSFVSDAKGATAIRRGYPAADTVEPGESATRMMARRAAQETAPPKVRTGLFRIPRNLTEGGESVNEKRGVRRWRRGTHFPTGGGHSFPSSRVCTRNVPRKRMSPGKGGREFFLDAAEAAVRHDQDEVAGPGGRGEACDDFVHPGEERRLAAQRPDVRRHLLRGEPLGLRDLFRTEH